VKAKKMNNEDIILLGRRAKDETEDFINQHLENPAKGWPKVRQYTYSRNVQYQEEYSEKEMNY
jgi:hypothetical protein